MKGKILTHIHMHTHKDTFGVKRFKMTSNANGFCTKNMNYFSKLKMSYMYQKIWVISSCSSFRYKTQKKKKFNQHFLTCGSCGWADHSLYFIFGLSCWNSPIAITLPHMSHQNYHHFITQELIFQREFERFSYEPVEFLQF